MPLCMWLERLLNPRDTNIKFLSEIFVIKKKTIDTWQLLVLFHAWQNFKSLLQCNISLLQITKSHREDIQYWVDVRQTMFYCHSMLFYIWISHFTEVLVIVLKHSLYCLLLKGVWHLWQEIKRLGFLVVERLELV